MAITEQIEVFRTGRSYEVLMVLNELKDAGVPAYGAEETSSGLVTAMPTTPSQAPGVTWIVRVPAPAAEDALRIIESLPVDARQEPGVWHFGPKTKTKRAIQIASGVILAMIIASFIRDIARWLTALFQ